MKHVTVAKFSQRRIWSCMVATLVGLGILFRISYLDRPVYWVDEVATSMRVSGYTHADVRSQVATGLPLTVADLQTFQAIRRDRPRADLTRVLTQSPEHAPLYFILARFWAETFGGSVVAMRSLPVLLSLLTLPAMYWLGRTLFHGHQDNGLVGQSAMGLLAISPFFISYSQEARPYSLWILLLVLMNGFCVRSLHSNRWSNRWSNHWQWWLSYALALVLCLYTSLLTVLVVFGQAIAVMLFYPRRRLAYSIVTGAALMMLAPWIWIVVTHWAKLQSNTSWMQVPSSIWAILGTWFYSLAVLFFDVPVASEMPVVFVLEVIVAIATLSLLGYAAYYLIRTAPRPIASFLLASALSVPGALLALDLLRNGQAAATPRYLMPTHLGALLALAYLMGDRLLPSTKKWNTAIALLLSVSLLSCLIGLNKDSPYLKSRNLSNTDIVSLLNQEQTPQLITTPYYIQDVMSLSYQLDPDISIYILPEKADIRSSIAVIASPDKPTFLFSPTEAVKAAVKGEPFGDLQSVFQPAPLISGGYGLTLWRLGT